MNNQAEYKATKREMMKQLPVEMLFSGIAVSLSRQGYGISVDDPRIPDFSWAILLRRDFLVAVRQRDISDMCYSLVHELGHILNPLYDLKAAAEVKADMFACSLLRMFGIDKSTESAKYVRGWLESGVMVGTWAVQTELAMKEKAKHAAERIWRDITE